MMFLVRNKNTKTSFLRTGWLLNHNQQQRQGQFLHYRSSTNYNSDKNDDKRPYFHIYYNDVYKVNLPPGHRFPMEKYGKVRRLVQQLVSELPQETKEGVNCDFIQSPLATVEELELTHSRDYIQRFLNGNQTEQEQRNVGFPWSQQGVKRALSSVGGTVAAACDVCEVWSRRRSQSMTATTQKDPTNHETAASSSSLPAKTTAKNIMPPWAAHVAGGTHHAFWDYGEGFCVFSDIAVAANVVLHRYPDLIQRILIIDLDVHQGNGNAVLFQDNPKVSTFSIQCEANYFSKRETSDLDIDLPVGCTDQTYLLTLNHWLNKVFLPEHKAGKNKYDLVFFQAGVDILEDDRLGRMDISQEGVQRRNELVYEFAANLNVPLVISMGGGYPRTTDWTPIIQAHANVYFQAHQFLANKGMESKRRDIEEELVQLEEEEVLS